MKMIDMRARLVAYVQPPGVTYVSDEGSSDMHRIFTQLPDGYRYAVVFYRNQYEIVDFATMSFTYKGWLTPTFGQRVFNDPDAAVVAAVLINEP